MNQKSQKASEDTTEDSTKRDRKKRVPLGTLRTKLTVAPIDGYVLRWINDVENRILNADAGGYEFVTYEELGDRQIGQNNATPDSRELGTKVSKTVGVTENGTPLVAYLMKIRQEWYDEDQASKQRNIDSMETGLINQDGADPDFAANKYGRVSIGR